MNIDFNAYDKLNAAIGYAQQVRNDSPRGSNTVVHLQNGAALACSYSREDAPRSFTHFIFSRTRDQKALNNATREVFRQAVIDIFGTRIGDVPQKVRDAMELGKFDGSGRPLTAHRILAVNKAIAAELKAFGKNFGFAGAGSAEVVSIVARDSGLENAADPAGEFKARVNRHATASAAVHLATQMSKGEGYKSFGLDIRRGQGLALGGRKVNTRDPAAARDMIVQFLTDRKDATFDTADGATQRKADVLMSLLNQGSLGCFLTGVSHAFDPQGVEVKYLGNELPDLGRQENAFSVTKDNAGNITIKGWVRYSVHAMVVATHGTHALNKVTGDDGSYLKYEGSIHLSAADMDKFAKADWSQCDLTQATALEGQSKLPDRFRKAADTIAPDYKFTGSVDATMKARINALHEMNQFFG